MITPEDEDDDEDGPSRPTGRMEIVIERGGNRAAIVYILIGAAKLNDIDPQAWLADLLKRIAEHPVQMLNQLLPWHWKTEQQKKAA